MSSTDAIFSIGYEGASIDAFTQTLVAAGVRMVMDVRAVPLSRRPGFSKNKLAGHLQAVDIAYIGLKGLGTPPDGRAAARRGNIAELNRIFGAHLQSQDARRDMTEAIRIAKALPSALVCFEQHPDCCHRKIVAGHIADATGQDIVHLHVPFAE